MQITIRLSYNIYNLYMTLLNVLNTNKNKTVHVGNESNGSALVPVVIPKTKLNFPLFTDNTKYYKKGSHSTGVGSVRNISARLGKT